MPTFGKREGGGRRAAERTVAPLPAIVTTFAGCKCMSLIDISCNGAKLCGRHIAPEGEEVEIKIETVRAFGTVVWSDGSQCGIEFDAPLAPFEVDRLRSDCATSGIVGLTVDERVALDDWLVGAAR